MAKKFNELTAPLYETEEGSARMAEIRSEMEAEPIAHQLGALRRALGVDQTELAKRLGMTQGAVSRLERSPDPKLSTLRKISHALGGTLRIEVDFDDLTVPLTLV